MTKEEFIAKKVKEAAQKGYYKVDLRLINECWETAENNLKNK